MAQNKKIEEYRRRIKKSKNNAKYPKKRVQKNSQNILSNHRIYFLFNLSGIYSAQNMREHAEYGNNGIFILRFWAH